MTTKECTYKAHVKDKQAKKNKTKVNIFWKDDIIDFFKLIDVKQKDIKELDVNPISKSILCKIGFIHRWTFDMLITNTRGMLLTTQRCKQKDCKKTIIVSFNAIKNEDIKTCPCCLKDMY